MTDDRLRALLDQRVRAALKTTTTTVAPIPRRADPLAPAPLSSGQRRLWFFDRLDGASSTHTVPLVLRLRGRLDPAALTAAIRDLAARHVVLRSTVSEVDGKPVATPVPAEQVPVLYTDAGPNVDPLLTEFTERGFALAGEPPMRALLARLADDDHVLALAWHHLAVDDWSIGVLLRDLDACYTARVSGGAAPAAPAIQYADYAEWERGADAPDPAWWLAKLDGLAPLLDLPADRPRPATAGRDAGSVALVVPAALADRVREAARAASATPFMVLLAGWQALLGRLAGVTDVAVGSPVAGRHHPDLDDAVGFFVNTVVLRTNLGGDPTWRQALSRVREGVLDAFAHAQVPFEQLVERLVTERSMASAPLVQVTMNLLADRASGAALGDVAVEQRELPTRRSAFDLSLDLVDTGGDLVGELVHRTDLFDEAIVRQWARWYLTLLDKALTEPDRPLSTLDIMGADTHAALLAAGRGEPPAAHPATVVDAVLGHAARTPGAIATSSRWGALTYGDLARWSGAVAEAVAAAGVGADSPVGVCLPRDHYLPAALLAIWRAGAAYLPLEEDQPPERLGWIAADAGSKLVLARGATLATASAIPGVTVLDLDRLAVVDRATPPSSPSAPHPDALAYLLYTSGSSGRPKGVEITHGNVAAFAASVAARPGIHAGDRMPWLAPLAFDASTMEVWAPLAAGAHCVVVERDCVVDGAALAARIATTGVTLLHAVPTTLRMLLAAGWAGDPGLRVWTGSETVDAALATDVLARVAELWNCYGPTETTVISTVHRVTGGATVPVGRALPGEHVYVMSEPGVLALPGTVGELWIGGGCVARGYHGAPELTAKAFVDDPFVPGGRCYRTGDLARWRGADLEFHGRRDHQVKVRGHRIELGEIEAVLVEREEIRQAVVTVHGDAATARLVGYLVPAAGTRPDLDEVAATLATRLPKYMVPRQWVVLDALPTVASGKVDRARLPEPTAAERPFAPPQGEAEELVAEVWRSVLGAAEVGRDDDFFALGGHSLAATQVAGALRAALDCEIPVRLLFDNPVLHRFAAALERLLDELDELADPNPGAHR